MNSSVEIDSLEILVIVDNVVDSLSTNPTWVEPEWRGLLNRGRIRVLSGSNICCGHHGLSLLLQARIGESTQTLLFDTGAEVFDDVSPLCIPLTVENSVVWISGEPEVRMEISAEVVFSLKVKTNVDVLDVQDFIDRNSVWSAGYVGGNWLGGYTSDSGGFLRCLNASQ